MTRRCRFLGVLGAMLSSCTIGGAAKRAPFAAPWRAAPDIAELERLWHGARAGCSRVHAPAFGKLGSFSEAWNCVVPGWDSVTVATGPAGRELRAHGHGWKRCELKRLARDVEILDSMEGKIVSGVTAILKSDLFSGTCVAAAFWYDRPGCDLALFTRREERDRESPSNSELQRMGCARR